jgi:2-(1,2-epoxy-1,2-dihydrophenyl)acetyl-CoA isomerase
MKSLITADQNESILYITLNRPDKLNSFTDVMARQLQEKLKNTDENKEVRCVLLTGRGKAFCAGQDLPEVLEKGRNHALGDTVRSNYNPIIKTIRKLEKPVVCAVNGTAAGAGANIAFSCDLVLAAKEAVFVQAFSKIGLIPDSGGTFFLPRLIGLQRSNIIYLLDEKISAQKAVEIGLIYKAVKSDELMAETERICQKLACMPTKGFALYKRCINQSFNNTLEEQLELEAELQTKAGETRDYYEGVQAFLEKRNPEFHGE